jgi:DNA-binding transcriptional LysR family regulator
MRTEDWKILEAIYKTKNLTEASKELFLSQPALSKRLKAIEKKMNFRIIVSNNKGISFTPEGEYLAKQSTSLLNHINETIQQAQTVKSKVKDDIIIGSASTFAKYYLVDILSQFKIKHPDVKTQIKVVTSESVPGLVESREARCGFMFGASKHTLQSKHIGMQQCFAVSNSPITYEQMPQMPLIWYIRNNETYSSIVNWWRDHFDQPLTIDTKVTNLDTALDFVEYNFGYTITFSSFIHKRKNFFLVPLYNLDGSPFVRDVWFLYSDKTISENLQKFIDFISEINISTVPIFD